MKSPGKRLSNDTIVAISLMGVLAILTVISVIVSQNRNSETIIVPLSEQKDTSVKGTKISGTQAAPGNLTQAAGVKNPPQGTGVPIGTGTPAALPAGRKSGIPLLPLVGGGIAILAAAGYFLRKPIRKLFTRSKPGPPIEQKPEKPVTEKGNGEIAYHAAPGSLAARHLARRGVPVEVHTTRWQKFIRRVKSWYQPSSKRKHGA
ncbi:MAG TPA: hypothetical protein VIO61_05725 [Anaerolineaceae bacterium]